MSASRPGSVAVLGALNVAELALLGKGLHSASIRRAGHLEHPNFVFVLFLQFFVLFCFVCKNMARYPPSLEPPALFLLDPLSSCSSRSSNSRSSSRNTAAAAGAVYSSSSTHLPSAISLAAASRVQTGMYHAPKWVLFSRLVYRVDREYKEQ